MAGITDGEYCKKFTKQNVDIITIGGFNADLQTFKAGLENGANKRKEFLTCPHHLPEDLYEQSEIIHNYNPKWNGLISANIRATKPEAFETLTDVKGIDIIEVNAHCRQIPTVTSGGGQALLENPTILSSILDYLDDKMKKDVSVKIRCNVPNVNTLEIMDIISSHNVKYLHIDATNPGIDTADYDCLNKISNHCNMHIIGNNSVKTHDDYVKMLDNGADSVSVARASLEGDLTKIFKE